MAAQVRFYLDENMQIAIADQLRNRGVDVVTARDFNQLGAEDINHLERATEIGRIFCTNDADYVDLASAGMQHAGIVLGQQDKHTIGVWVKFLAKMYGEYTAEEMVNSVKYVQFL